jgi:hypothetical protein
MAYERASMYFQGLDLTQAPVFMAMLACRRGGTAPCSPPDSSVYLDLGCTARKTILAIAPLDPAVSFIVLDFNTVHISAESAWAIRASALPISARFPEISPGPTCRWCVASTTGRMPTPGRPLKRCCCVRLFQVLC